MITKEIFEFKDDNKTLYYAAYNEYSNIIKENNKFYAKVKCRKCHGEGKIAPFIHIAKGTCFDCKGEGYPITFKVRHTPGFHKGLLTWYDNGKLHGYMIKTDEYIGGIAAGQFCTIYSADETDRYCLGSGEIAL